MSRKSKKLSLCIVICLVSSMIMSCGYTVNINMAPGGQSNTNAQIESEELGFNNVEEADASQEEVIPEDENIDEAISGDENVEEQYIEEEEKADMSNPTGLCDLYKDNFPIGVALPLHLVKNTDKAKNIIIDNFNSITCENEMKPDFVLDKSATRKDVKGNYEHAKVNFDACTPAINFALENNMKMRLHTLVWHSQTPAWFFTEDYTDDGELVSREVMLKRMENYIADVLGYFSENYPGLIYAVDVCNEAFDVGDGDENNVRMKKNRWYDTVGDDYYYQAFVFARKYAGEGMKLFYNDYACAQKYDLILKHLAKAKEEGLIDGIGMQSHLSIDDRITARWQIALKKFCDAGYEVQITELDIGIKNNEEPSLRTQGRKYKILFNTVKELQEEGYPITGVTIWGLSDGMTWRQGEYPLLFDEKLEPKPAYDGAMLLEDIYMVE